MRQLSSIAIVIVTVAVVNAQDDAATAKAKAALALAKVRREASAPDAKQAATNALAKCLADRESKMTCLTDMHEAARLAAKENRRLFFWVGMTCHDHQGVHAAFKDGVHVHLQAVHGSGTPRLLIGTAPGVTSHLFELPKSEITPQRVREIIGVPKKILMETPAVPAMERVQRTFVSSANVASC